MPSPALRSASFASLTLAALAGTASAQLIIATFVAPVRDATLYEDENGATASGSGPALIAGRTATDSLRRALIAFDLTFIPPGSTILGATLTLNVTRIPPNGGPVTSTLHRVSSAWGEGASIDEGPGGIGTIALTGDATWFYTFFETTPWSTPGGDFVATPSASLVLDDVGSYTWGDTGTLADARAWHADPATNHGWLLRVDESVTRTARRFESRESPELALRPFLLVTYTPPTTTCPFDLNNDGTLDPDDLADYIAGYFAGC